MVWHAAADVDEFLFAAGEFVRSRVASNTLMLSTLGNLTVRGPHAYGEAPPRLGWWTSGGEVAGAYLQTPPHPMILTDVPDDAVAPLIAGLNPDRVNAERGLAQAIGEIWHGRTGVEPVVERRTRLYRLVDLFPPDPAPPGRSRLASGVDRDLVREWYVLFHREVGEGIGDLDGIIADRLDYGGLTLWEVDSLPVAVAGRTRASAGMIRIGPVFTPVELRGRGYASAVTAAVSAAARQLADEVLLFTDLSNPVSNAIYQRLGYQPIHDRWVVSAR
jgi:hypothetical protein